MSGTNPTGVFNGYPLGPQPVPAGTLLLAAASNQPGAPMYNYPVSAIQGITGDLTNGTVLVPGTTTPRTLGTRFGEVIDVKDYGAAGDWVALSGAVSHGGSTVTIAGHTFTPGLTPTGDVGKQLILPAGGASGAPILTQITALGPGAGQVQVATPATVAYSGVANQFNAGSAPNGTAINAPGGGYAPGDIMQAVGTAARPATFRAILVSAVSATVANAGTNGPPGPFVGTGTTGNGLRVQVSGTISAGGSITGALTIAQAGGYWNGVVTPASEPITANPVPYSSTAIFASGTNFVEVATVIGLPNNAFLPGMPIAASGIPQGTVISTISGPVGGFFSVTISQNTTAAALSGTPVTITLNSNPVFSTATLVNGTSTITVASTTGMGVGMGISGSGIFVGTTIFSIVGTTLTLTNPSALSGVGIPITVTPLLTGAIISVVFGLARVCIVDPGAYVTLPSRPLSVTAVTGVGSGATLTPPTLAIQTPLFTDDTAAFNAAFAVVRALGTNGSALLNIPADIYGFISPINATNIATNGFVCEGNGAQFYSAAAGGIAFDLFGGRQWKAANLTLMGDQYFRPQLLLGVGQIRVAGGDTGDSFVFENIYFQGFVQLAGAYSIGSETSVWIRCVSLVVTSTTQSAYLGGANPLLNGSNGMCGGYSVIFDAMNNFGVSSTFAPQTLPAQTLAHSGGPLLIQCSFGNNGAGSSIYFAGVVSTTAINGYGYTYGPPGIVICCLTQTGSGAMRTTNLQYHLETGDLTDAFLITGINGTGAMAGLVWEDENCFARNSIFALDPHVNFFLTEQMSVRLGATSGTTTFFDAGVAAVTKWIGNVSYNAAFHTAVPFWTQPLLFQGLLDLGQDNISLTVNNISVQEFEAVSVLNVTGSATFQGNVVFEGAIFAAAAPGLPPYFVVAENVNGIVVLGPQGTTANPSAVHPLFQFQGPLNTLASTASAPDGQFTTLASGVLTTGAKGSAGVTTFAMLARANPISVTGTLTNGGTFTLLADPGPPRQVPGAAFITVSGSIAAATIVLPAETLLTDGYIQDVFCTGTVGAVTWVSPGTLTIHGAPTTLSPTGHASLTYHVVGGTITPQWCT